MNLAEQHRICAENPEAFWQQAASLIDWSQAPTRALPDAAADGGWFADGRLNTCHNALDRHVQAGHGDRPAVVFESGINGASQILSYAELAAKVQECAAVLQRLGARAGDRVLIFMPMIPDVVVGMLACARIGAIHSVVFGGFAAPELAARIDDAEPKVLLVASCGLEPSRVVDYMELVNGALTLAEHSVDAVLVKQRPEHGAVLLPGRDHDWDHELAAHAGANVPCVDRSSSDPLYILYTSGTTGRPKGVVRDNGGHAVALAWSMANIFDITAGDVWWAASDVGWVVGHSYIVYAPLLAGSTTVLYEGKPVGTPDAGTWWRICEKHQVRGLFAAPTAIRAIRRADEPGEHVRASQLTSLKTLYVAGERIDPETADWARRTLQVPVVDNWWQTETGWPITVTIPSDESDSGASSRAGGQPSPGYDIAVLNDNGEPVPTGDEGSICIRLPLPPGPASAIWGDEERYTTEYLSTFEGYYLTGDGGFLDENGRLHVLGRTDDVINVAGHRLSTGALEAIVAAHRAVAECAVIGRADALKGQTPHAIVVLKDGHSPDTDAVATEIVELVRAEFGAVAALREVHIVSALPKTRSGKLLRRTMRDLAEGRTTVVPGTVEDPSIVESLRGELGTTSQPAAR
ncbi:AMP-binding protein [Kribbella sp. NPDC051137]|uniref:AMP-binding protein n=1 Tax=Kribbella sp. NPDC051137 TaxID=3155045 RepID=UPI003444D3DF